MLPAALWLGTSWAERAVLIGSVMLVLIVELLNSGIEAAIDGLKNGGKAKETKIVMPSEVVTPENAQAFYFPDSIY